MIPDSILETVVVFLNEKCNTEILDTSAVGGGSINQAFQLKTNIGSFFLKYNSAGRYPEMFQKEAKGLKLLRDPGIISVPEVLLVEETEEHAFLLLEYVDSGVENPDFWDDFAQKLANLHKVKSDKFGLDHDNYMGSLHQYNHFHDDWTEFFIIERLERQVKLAREDGNIGRNEVAGFERIYKRLDEIFPPTQPSLIHGDLWSGNFMVDAKGEACLIDPALYYGHPETDIAMSTLFGGFSKRFYEAYNQHYPLEKGWQNRLEIYNLYPLMVHVNLFGGGYLSSVQRVLRRF
jgi:fructosamine-3-kinase